MKNIFIIFIVLLFFSSFANAEVISTLDIPDGKVSMKRIMDNNHTRPNPDGTKFSKTKLIITVEYKGKKQVKELLSNLYTHISMAPSMLFDPDAKVVTIFMNGKTASYDYGMEGYAFRYDIGSKEWKKEKIFDNANWGWFSFFEGSENGQPVLWHFSYAGYYAVKSIRAEGGSWSNTREGSISPEQAKHIYEKSNKILIASTTGHQVMTTSSDSSNAEAAIAVGATAIIAYGLYKLFSGGDSTGSSSYSTGSSYSQKYGCKFCCEGQWGSCRSSTIQVNTPYSNSVDAQSYVRKQYENMCKKYPFYSGGGGTASVSLPSCEPYYYND